MKSILIFTLLIMPLLAKAKDCTVEQVYGSCDKLQNSDLILRTDKDGSIVPNLYKILGASDQEKMDPHFKAEITKIISTPKNPVENQKKLKKVMDHIRDSYIELALNGRSEDDPTLDAATQSIIKRLRTLKLAEATEKEGECDTMITNAFYQPGEHVIKICNGLAKSPDPMLLFIVAHEVGHSIDSCRLSTALLQVDADVKNKTCSESLTVSETPEALSAQAGKMMSADEFSVHASTLEKCKFANVVAAPQTNLGKNQVARIVDCVLTVDGKNSGYQVQPFEYLLKQARDQLKIANPTISDENLKRIMEQSEASLRSSYEKYMASMIEINRRGMGCSNLAALMGKPNTSSERSADTLAAKVVKRYLEKNNINEEQRKSLIEFQAQIACGYKLSGGKKFNSPIYPKEEERAHILFQEPVVQKTLGCTFRGPEVCSENQIANSYKSEQTTKDAHKEEGVK